jgi:hypothetical protein
MYVYVCMYVRMHVCMYVCMYVCVYACQNCTENGPLGSSHVCVLVAYTHARSVRHVREPCIDTHTSKTNKCAYGAKMNADTIFPPKNSIGWAVCMYVCMYVFMYVGIKQACMHTYVHSELNDRYTPAKRPLPGLLVASA